MLNKNTAHEKLTQAIETGVGGAHAAVERVMTEVPTDAVVRAAALTFEVDEDGRLGMGWQDTRLAVGDHATAQVMARSKLGMRFFDEFARGGEAWQRDLVTHNLNEIFDHSQARHLVRSVGGTVRGFLSDQFRRLDSRPLVEAFVTGCQRFGALPISGHAGEARVTVKAIVPEIVELWTGEFVVVGLEFANSDYGAGTVSLRSFLLRLICNNGATAEDVMSMRHLGKRLHDDVEFSTETYRLDTAATVSALSDLVAAELGPARRTELTDRVRAAQAETVTWGSLRARLAKALTKKEIEDVERAFKSPDVINLPPEPTLWRASNALSWVAHTIENPTRRLDFEKLAGGMLTGKVVDTTVEIVA